MKIKKYFGLILFCTAFNAQAFDAVKLDEAVLGFLNKWFGHECTDIGYSYHHVLRVDIAIAYEGAFYAKGEPLDFHPYRLPTDIFVNFETTGCLLEANIKGFGMTLRKDSSGRYKIIGYSAFGAPI